MEIIWKLNWCFLTLVQRSGSVFVRNGTGISAKYVFDPLLEAFNALKDKLAVIYVPLEVTDQEKEKTFVEKMP